MLRIKMRILIGVIIAVFTVSAVKSQNSVYLNLTTQSQKVYSFSSISKILPQESSLVVKLFGGTSESYSYSNLVSLTFNSSTGFANVSDNSVYIYPNPVSTLLTVRGAMVENSVISIYSISGKLLYSTKVKSADIQIPVSELAPGLYLIRINNQTIKFSKL